MAGSLIYSSLIHEYKRFVPFMRVVTVPERHITLKKKEKFCAKAYGDSK